MLKLHLDILPKYRLQLNLVKRRGDSVEEPILPDFEDIKNTRSGNKVSRFFRHVFEHKNIRKILGTNLVLGMITASAFPATAVNFTQTDAPITQEVVQFTTQHGVKYPIQKVAITQKYSLFHPGLDLDGITGDPIYPIMGGIVESVSSSKFAYGNSVIVNHGNRITSLYAHLSKIEVKEGQSVTTQTEIGKMGATGRARGDHLHLEVRDHGIQINPLSILPR